MRVFSERKISQSGTKLALAVFFSFLLHVLLFAASILMLSVVTPRTYIPPSYQVKLVGQPSDLTPESQAQTAPAAPKKEEKPRKEPVSHKAKKAISKQSTTALKKGAMPELVQKQKKAVPEPAQPETTPEQAAGPSVPEQGPAKSGGTSEGVAVGTTSSEFKFPPYLAIVREKIEQNWNPPPSTKNVTAKVLFKILRSGRVDDPKLEKSSGQFYFDQAAIRAILLSNPFPPLPEGFYKDYEVFSVDLMEKE
jgi:TonB family protein